MTSLTQSIVRLGIRRTLRSIEDVDIDNAIAKLNEFKKVAKKIKGECELVDMNDSSFTFKVQFSKSSNEHKVIGFAAE